MPICNETGKTAIPLPQVLTLYEDSIAVVLIFFPLVFSLR